MAHSIILKKLVVESETVGEAVQFIVGKTITPAFTVYAHGENTGNIYVGHANIDSEWIPRAPGTISGYVASGKGDLTNGNYFNLSEWYMDSDIEDDKIVVEYYSHGGG